jgi:hypothetical protein
LNRQQYVSYAYALNGLDWGMWNTEFNPVKFTVTEVTSLKKTTTVKEPQPDTPLPDIFALSEISEYRSAAMAADNDATTVYSSFAHPRKEYTAALSIKSDKSVKRVSVTPRTGGLGFPSAFLFQYSDDAVIWKNIEGAAYSNYSPNGDGPVTFTFDKAIKSTYIRLVATELGEDEFGAYVLQIAEFKIVG